MRPILSAAALMLLASPALAQTVPPPSPDAETVTPPDGVEPPAEEIGPVPLPTPLPAPSPTPTPTPAPAPDGVETPDADDPTEPGESDTPPPTR